MTIQKLADTFTAFQEGTLEDVKGFCAVADLQEIEKQDFILTPGRDLLSRNYAVLPEIVNTIY